MMSNSMVLRIFVILLSTIKASGFLPPSSLHRSLIGKSNTDQCNQVINNKNSIRSTKRIFNTRLHSSNIPSHIPEPHPRKKKLKSFLRFLEVESWKNEEIRDLEPVLKSIGAACKQINRIVQRAQTDDLYGNAASGDMGETNIQGEVQQKLDVLCNEIFLKALCGCSTDTIAAVASEEEDLPRSCSEVMVSICQKLD